MGEKPKNNKENKQMKNDGEGEKLQIDENNRLQYKYIIELIKYEGERLWQVFYLYLIVHTILLGWLINLKDETTFSFILGIAGVLLCIPWAGAYFRHSEWYIFRINDAQEIEKKLNWEILRKKRKFRLFQEILRPMNLTPFIIIGFSAIYLYFVARIHKYGLVLVLFPLIILVNHFYLLCFWKKSG